jgi:hypothetical protein
MRRGRDVASAMPSDALQKMSTSKRGWRQKYGGCFRTVQPIALSRSRGMLLCAAAVESGVAPLGERSTLTRLSWRSRLLSATKTRLTTIC